MAPNKVIHFVLTISYNKNVRPTPTIVAKPIGLSINIS
jgi:hypothetical protein